MQEIILQSGQVAGEGWERHFLTKRPGEGAAFWVRGHQQKLSSYGFASCVGLVLYGDSPGYGAVIHFWNPAGLQEARQIVDQYMAYLLTTTGAYAGDDMQALVFGGEALQSTAGSKAAARFTLPRIDAIAGYLADRWDLDDSAIIVDKVGASGVELDLTQQSDDLNDLYTLIRPGNSSSKVTSKSSLAWL